MTVRSIPLAPVLLALLLSVGCTAAATPTPDPGVDPQEVLSQAVDRLMALESGEFTLEHQEGTTVLLPGVEMTRVSGVAEIPDKFELTVEAEVSSTFVETSVVVVEDRAYMTNFLTGQWQEVTMEVLPLNFTNLGQGLAQVGEVQWQDLHGYFLPLSGQEVGHVGPVFHHHHTGLDEGTAYLGFYGQLKLVRDFGHAGHSGHFHTR